MQVLARKYKGINSAKPTKLVNVLGHTVMPLALCYDIGRELHELKHRNEFLPTRNEIIDKFGDSILLSYSGLVVSYVTRKEVGFIRVLPSRITVRHCRYRRTIATQLTRLQRYLESIIVSFEHAQNFYSGRSVLLDNIELANSP